MLLIWRKFSLSQLQEENAALSGEEGESKSDPALPETRRVKTKAKFFRKPSKTSLGDQASSKVDEKLKVAAKPEVKAEDVGAAAKQVVRARTEKPVVPKAVTKPAVEPESSKVVTFKKPGAAEPPAMEGATQVAEQTNPIAKVVAEKQATASEVETPLAALRQRAKDRDDTGRVRRKKAPAQYQPLPGAWVALAILALVVGLGLFMAYRTFFSNSGKQSYLRGSVQSEPTVVKLGDEPQPFELLEAGEVEGEIETPSEEGVDETNDSSEAVEGDGAATTQENGSDARPNREATVNNELRVDTVSFNNFLLTQDEEWAELLHGMKKLETSEKYSAEQAQGVRQELFDDLKRKLELKGEVLREDAGFKALYDYVGGFLSTGE